MTRTIRMWFGTMNEWVQDPVGLVTIFLALLLASIVYLGITK